MSKNQLPQKLIFRHFSIFTSKNRVKILEFLDFGLKYLNFRAKNQIENWSNSVFWVQMFEFSRQKSNFRYFWGTLISNKIQKILMKINIILEKQKTGVICQVHH